MRGRRALGRRLTVPGGGEAGGESEEPAEKSDNEVEIAMRKPAAAAGRCVSKKKPAGPTTHVASLVADEADKPATRDIVKARLWQSLWDSLPDNPDALPEEVVARAREIQKTKRGSRRKVPRNHV